MSRIALVLALAALGIMWSRCSLEQSAESPATDAPADADAAATDAGAADSLEDSGSGEQTARRLGVMCFLAPPRDRRYDLVQELGAGWVRQSVSWTDVERTRGERNWSPVWNMLSEIPTDIRLIVNVLSGKADWATSCAGGTDRERGSCPPRPEAEQSYAEFVRELVTTLASLSDREPVEHFIIENEANAPFFFDGSADDYVRTRRIAYEAIKSANPRALVIDTGFSSGAHGLVTAAEMYANAQGDPAEVRRTIDYVNGFFGNSYDRYRVRSESDLRAAFEMDELRRTLEFVDVSYDNAADSMDIAAIHSYSRAEYLDEVIDWVERRMARAGFSKPIWLSEMGLADEQDDISDEEAGLELEAKHRVAFDRGIDTVIWFMVTNTCSGDAVLGNNEPLYRLRDGLFELTPAGEAYRRL